MEKIIIPLPINTFALWVLYFLMFGIWIVFTLIFMHHWNYYGMNDNKRLMAKTVYFVISAVLLLAGAFLIGVYDLT